MKCQKCGHENSEHTTHCEKCGELVRESTPPSQSQEEGIASVPNSNDPILRTQGQTQTNSTKSLNIPVAAIAALTGMILFIAALALTIYHYELIIDAFVDHEIPHDLDDFRLRANVAKAMVYSQMTGYIFVVLAVLLLVQGCLARYRKGVGLNRNLPSQLVRIRYLVIIALFCVTAAFCLYLFLVEVKPDLSEELMFRLSSLLSILPQVAWVSLAMTLFLVARRI